jgi:TRAP-type mannitol/chloroaromatic compound transport system permease large subunit
MVMILLMASTFLGSVFSALGTPTYIAETLVSWNIWVPIVVIIVPIFMPMLEIMKVDMVWFSILLAVTLQTCWLSPPVALSAYYLKGIMPSWDLADIYKGMMPFMALQWIAVLILYFFPQIILALPNMIFGNR